MRYTLGLNAKIINRPFIYLTSNLFNYLHEKELCTKLWSIRGPSLIDHGVKSLRIHIM